MSHDEVSLRAREDSASPARPAGALGQDQESRAGTGLAWLLQVHAENISGPAKVAARPFSSDAGEQALVLRRRLRTAFFGGLPKLLIVLTLLWGLCFNFSEVRGSSMEPGIQDHDRILVDHVTYLLQPVGRGDIVILRYPLDPNVDYIKRVVGLPGDEIVLAGGKVWVNGELLNETYIHPGASDPYTHTRVVVAPEHYYVLGDNRLRSSDSREFGQVPRDLLRGKVQACIWPLARLRWIQ